MPSTWTPTTPFLQNSGLTVMSPGNQTAMPGSDTLLNLGSFSDTNSGANSWSVDVNWGDSTPDTTFTTSTQGSLGQAIHNFAQGGIYTATVRVTDNLNASNSANFQVNVSSGTVNGISVTPPANQTANAGTSTFFNLGSFSDTNNGANSWTIDVNWGDSSADTVFPTTTQGNLGSVQHTYAQGGNYTATVRVIDNLNNTNSATFLVNVSGAANGVTVTSPGTQTANAGTPTSFNLGSFSDTNSGA
ncbi:MAG TPA: PKD domain-containing protein, partial [Gemmataceae bacterium]|nr:PKD domain-containing protein [Gemmataceae bacterium]